METLKINIPDGYEIDVDNTNLATGEISLRPIKKLPKTWDEFCENTVIGIKQGESYININSDIYSYRECNIKRDKAHQKYLLPDRETAEAMLALCQLIQLRDYYNGSWKPNWNITAEKKYIIYIERNGIMVGTNATVSKILSFKTQKLRDEFLENFRDLIEIAKLLL